jgi:chromosome segregation ATPase
MKDVKIDSSDKDILISQLKAQVFELEQNEKNFNALNQKFRGMQNDMNLLNEEKLKNEYEFKQRSESSNKQVNELRSELENLNQAYNEKMVLNKKLYAQLEKLQKLYDSSNMENDQLRGSLDELNHNLNQVMEEKNTFERMTIELKDIKQRNQHQIEKLFDENGKLKKTCDEQDKIIKNLENERTRCLTKIDDMNFENSNLGSKLKSREDTLLITQKQLEDAKQTILKFQNKTNELENYNDGLKTELEKMRLNNNKETKGRLEAERQCQELERMVKERDNDIRRYNEELDFSRVNNEKLVEDNEKLFSEIEKLKNHIILLTEQNQKLTEELDLFVDQDEKIKQQLMRRDRVTLLKKSNQFYLEKSLSKFDETNNNVNNNSRNLSPNHHNMNNSVNLNRSKAQN